MKVRRSLFWEVYGAWRTSSKARTSLLLLLAVVLICFVGPMVTRYSFETQDLALGATPPGRAHWFGTDVLGRDLFVRVLHGGRISMLVGVLATAIAVVIGVLWGLVSGYYAGRVDAVMMRFVDILYSLPFVLFVVLLMTIFQRNLVLLFLAIGAVEWLTMARIVRGQVGTIRHQDFISAAVLMGQPKFRIMMRHVLPNVLSPVIVYATLIIPQAMLLEAFLSFLGLGVQPPMSSWGLLIASGVETMEEYPWLLVFPGLMLSISTIALTLIGNSLRDALDLKGLTP